MKKGILLFAAILMMGEILPAQDGIWQTATITTVPVREEVVGTLQPTTVTTLSSKVMGNVIEVLKREGEMVKAGDILVKIDAKDIGSDMAGAKASLAEAQAAAVEVRSHIQTAQAAKEAAESDFKLAEVSFARVKELYEKKSVSQQEFDQANTRFLQAKSALTQAQSQITSLQAKLAQVGAKNEQARAGISKVSTIKDLAEVRAPFDGRVVSRKVEPGMLAAPGVPLLVLEDVGRIRFEALVPERLLSYVLEGTSIPVKIDAIGSETFMGTVVEIVPGSDPLSHTFTAKLSMPVDSRSRTGLYTRGLVAKGEESVLLVPESAIQRRGQLEGLMVKAGDKTIFRLIKTGKRHEGQVEVLSGLSVGESYAVSPATR